MDRSDAGLAELLPPHLRERTRSVRGRGPADGEFVLYWMRTALRGHENPALDAALTLAERLDRPVLVYQGLSERYPFASDRHHTFILQGARDVAAELRLRGIAYALHLEREGDRRPRLAELARRAGAVVTEEMPVEPLRRWTERLAERAEAPVLTVDTACLVPMPLTERPFERAFEFRRATAPLRRERLTRPWPGVEPRHPPRVPELPFEPVDPAADPAVLLRDCAIDHGVAPVPHTEGGSSAGYRRWERFRRDRLDRYARDRNDPLRDGVSRLSPYLHYGMVSPFRIAREAAASGGKGAEKFLDELLVWRELAYHFCFHRPDHASIEALPRWARLGLRQQESDPRPQLPSWETLARARSGDPLWDTAQTSLLRHGELHNNVRMTWGKAVLSWTPNAAAALELLEDLNHRYALDGRDPASYGGILWCLGQFDRPFRPERPILGPVRARSTEGHARRLDLERYRRRCSAPSIRGPSRVLVVGAGISGLACARTLADAGLQVLVVDKGQRPGGRASTRQIPATFDHGAQYFTVRDRRFEPYVRAWRHEGVVASWGGRIGTLENGRIGAAHGSAERWVGVPGMGAICARLALDLKVASGIEVASLQLDDGVWTARDRDGGAYRAEVVVLAVPAPQAAALVGSDDPLAATLGEVEMAPCLAAMASFAEPWELPLDGAFVSASPVSWMARDTSKPGRAGGERWVVHAGPEFSRERLEHPPESWTRELLAAAGAAAERPLPPLLEVTGHRWRYALATRPLEREFLFDPDRGIGACGDWCPGARVEGAFTSGVALAGEILRLAASATAAAGGSGPERRSDPPDDRPAQLRFDLRPPDAGPPAGSAP